MLVRAVRKEAAGSRCGCCGGEHHSPRLYMTVSNAQSGAADVARDLLDAASFWSRSRQGLAGQCTYQQPESCLRSVKLVGGSGPRKRSPRAAEKVRLGHIRLVDCGLVDWSCCGKEAPGHRRGRTRDVEGRKTWMSSSRAAREV